MDIQKYIYNKTGVMLPISDGNGRSQNQAVVISSEAKYVLIPIQNELISAMLDNGSWRKVGQSLIVVDDGKKFDKVTIHQYLDDGEGVERVVWFNMTNCFGK